MQQLEILHKRNLFIYYSLLLSIAAYFIILLIGIIEYRYYYPHFAVLSIIFLGLLFYLKISPRIIQVALLTFWNFNIIFLVIQSNLLIPYYWFVFFILLSTVYQSIFINIFISLLSFIEISLLYKYFYEPMSITAPQLTKMYASYLLLVCLIGILQTLYIKKLWKRVETANLERERELTSTEAYLQLFFEQAGDAIAVFDLDDKIITVNPAFESLYGWSKEECIGNSLPLVPAKNVDAAQDRLQRLMRGERFNLFETEDMKKDGTIFDAQISLDPIYNRHNEMIALSVISRDISYIKENERLKMQSEKLKLAGEIAAGVAHEIRNPMTVISGFVQMINADSNSPYKRYTEIIQSEIDRIDIIISEFLVLSRPQLGSFKELNMHDIVNEMVTFFKIECQNRNIELSKRAKDVYAVINGNENQIKQVFINIMKNAIEAIDRNGKISISLYTESGYVFIHLKDTGIGIPQQMLERIFEPFYTTKSKGTGLGMMITNKIIQDHGGKITIQSQENIGTEILIKIPILN
ncbi:two-component system sensor histidine kinase NtrB [Lysinibacillus sp. 54212]|uniref:two-component system sensor histidine kinase NtrB n=1 Tax=Lysinibacillus sp. 54212 TaxID=3119829 RepID=UPI002FCB4F16